MTQDVSPSTRSTAPQSPFGRQAVIRGVLVWLVGILVVFALPLLTL